MFLQSLIQRGYGIYKINALTFYSCFLRLSMKSDSLDIRCSTREPRTILGADNLLRNKRGSHTYMNAWKCKVTSQDVQGNLHWARYMTRWKRYFLYQSC
jgi:hypothetical protein